MDARQRRPLWKRFADPRTFWAEIALLLAGAGTAQAIMVLTAPLLSRLYSPAEFAGLALLTSAVGILSRVSAFKYEVAIATARNRPEMGALAAVSIMVIACFAAAALVLPLLAFPLLEARIGLMSAIAFCICLPLVTLFDGLIHVVITWAVRWRQFRAVSANDVTRNATSVAVQASAGLAGAGGPGLMMGQTVGTFVALVALGWRGTLGELLGRARASSWQRRRAVARRYRDFPLYQMPKGAINATARYMPPVLISIFYSATATGLFFLAFRLTALPAQLVSQSLGRVLTQRFADLRNVKRKSLLPLLIRSTLGFTLVAVPIVVVMALFGEPIFGFFLGREWAPAGRFAAWTALWSATLILGTPAQMSLMVQRKNQALLTVEAIFVVPRLAPFPWFAAQGDVEAAVACCCVAAALYNSTMIGMGLFHSAREGRRMEPGASKAS